MIASLPRHQGAGHPVKLVVYERNEFFLCGLVSRGDLSEKERYLFLRLFCDVPLFFCER